MKIREKLLIELEKLNSSTKEVSIEHLRLFIADEKQQRIALGADPLECYVLDIKDLKEFLAHHLESDSPINKRFQLIIHNRKHYLALDILWGEHEKKCLLLDAANDARMMPAYFALEIFSFNQIFVASSKINTEGRSTNLQQDYCSCSIFALDHVFQLSKMDISHKLEGENFDKNQNTVNWEELPIQLIWNAQSLKFLDNYIDKNIKLLTQYELERYSNYRSKSIQVSPEGKTSESLCSRKISAIVSPKFARITRLSLGRDRPASDAHSSPNGIHARVSHNDFTARRVSCFARQRAPIAGSSTPNFVLSLSPRKKCSY